MGVDKIYSADVVGNKQADMVGNVADNPYRSYTQKEYEDMIDKASLEECKRLNAEIEKVREQSISENARLVNKTIEAIDRSLGESESSKETKTDEEYQGKDLNTLCAEALEMLNNASKISLDDDEDEIRKSR